jgi:lactate dehydrogenase-like 2-hydroxyacid dehydrogenase
MKPELLVLAASPSAAVMQQLDTHFNCHHLWQTAPEQRDALIAEAASRIRGVVSTGQIGISAELIAKLPALEIVAVNGVGVDAVDFDAARERGIVITNTPGVLTDDVADMAVTLMLSLARRVPALDRYVREGDWERKVALAPSRSLRGKVAGIFGFGRIGQAIAQRLAAFGMTVQYYQPRPKAGVTVPRAESLLGLAQASDVLIVAAPGGASTRHVIDADILAALGPEASLVNIARGSLIDEAALVEALRTGTLGAAALDVFSDEPRVPAELRALDNVVLTPHVGSLTVETRHAMGQLVVDNLLGYFGGKGPVTPVA